MNRFQHIAPDNVIIINDFMFPFDWWTTQEPDYQVPAHRMGQVIGQIYVPGKRHHLTVKRGDDLIQEDGGVWPEGDGYIAKAQQYQDAYLQSLLPPPPTLEELAAIEAANKRAQVEKEVMDMAIIDAAKKEGASQLVKDEAQKLEAKLP